MQIKFNWIISLFGFVILLILVISCTSDSSDSYREWKIHGGGNDKILYSSLNEIDTNNVKDLQVAWTYHTNDAESSSQLQVNPIVVDGILYGVSPKLKLFALDPKTGKEKWVFDPLAGKDSSAGNQKKRGINICRGIAYYKGEGKDKFIFYTVGSYLYCIDVFTGKPSPTFGNKGSIDLHNDLGRDVSRSHVTATSPGIIYKDLIVMGIATSEDANAAPGHIRAYDVHTGKMRWIFHTIPYPGEPGYESWDDPEAYKHIGGANVWAGFSLDEERGIVFAPTGSAADDWYGGKRLGNNLYANSVIALDAATGKLKWSYQTIHHDVWDRDLPAAPALVSVLKDGKKTDAVLQVTKTGFIFLLDRETGQPLYPVEERPVPQETDLTGDKLSPTQPYPTFFKPFVRQSLTEADLNTNIPDSSYRDIKAKLSTYKTGHLFNPPSKTPTLIFPGMTGGAEWGGPSFDPTTGIMYINANEIPRLLTIGDAKEEKITSNQTNLKAGKILFANNCAACHGPDRKGNGDFPSLIDVGKKYDLATFLSLLSTGKNRMPGFNHLGQSEKTAIASFILDQKSIQHNKFVAAENAKDEYHQIPYSSTSGRPSKFETKEGYPAVSPPWGTLTAINLNTGEFIWKQPLGDYPELKAKGIHSGTENFGGPVVTAGGVLFIAATSDGKFRAFNKRTGELLWETDLPAAGFATPSIYEIEGKQFVVIACGGGKLKTKSGDSFVAFSLPDEK